MAVSLFVIHGVSGLMNFCFANFKFYKMKKINLFLCLLLIPFINKAQTATVLSGNILNMSDNHISLAIIGYDTVTMRTTYASVIETKTDEKGNFVLQTFEIKKANTLCRFITPREFTLLYLSPGDSIYLSIDYLRFDESIKYSGRGAGKNNYRMDYFLKFEDRLEKEQLMHNADVSGFLKSYEVFNRERVELLDLHYKMLSIDSSFYQMEQKRIQFESAADMLRYFKGNGAHTLFPEESIQFIRSSVRNGLSIKNLPNIDIYSLYEDLVLDYVDFELIHAKPPVEANLGNMISFSNNNFSGITRKYVQQKLVYNTLERSNNNTEKALLLNYFSAKISDPDIIAMLNLERERLSDTVVQFDSDVVSILLFVVAIVLALLGLIYFLSKNKIQLKNAINYAKWLKYGILILMGTLVVGFWRNHDEFQYILIIISLVVIFAAHTYLLIPKLALKKKYISYTFSAVLLIGLGMAFMLKVNGYDSNIVYHGIKILSWLIFLLASSWAFYYVSYVAKHRVSFKQLIQEKKINLEILSFAIIILIINAFFAGNISSAIKLSLASAFYAAIIVFLIHNFYLVPKFLFKKRISAFVISILFVMATWVVLFTIIDILETTLSMRQMNIPISLKDFIFMNHGLNINHLVLIIILAFPAALYNYIKQLVLAQQTQGFSMFRAKEAELMHLRSQVNPHFLFNTLNTLYAYALQEKSEKTAEPIAKLANMMRYMIEDMDKEYIPLQKEAGYINDYIKLQSIRSAVEHNIHVNISIEPDADYVIAPMLFIPFVENAFKHGINPNKESLLHVDIKAQKGEVQFVIENSVDNNFEAFYKEKGFGIGIDNVTKRLEYIYPGKHNISIAKTEAKFMVIIKIKLGQSAE